MFLAIVERQEDRGIIVAQGGGKVRKSPTLSTTLKLLHTTIHSIYLHTDQNIFIIMQALLPLASESTDVGKIKAAQALAKIAITSNPEIAFPGERVSQRCIILTLVSLFFFSCMASESH